MVRAYISRLASSHLLLVPEDEYNETTPVIRRCPDGHFRRVIYDFAGYIADYPEQCLVSGVLQDWDPKYVYSFLI
jgi:hypothetical protein